MHNNNNKRLRELDENLEIIIFRHPNISSWLYYMYNSEVCLILNAHILFYHFFIHYFVKSC